MEYNTTEDQSTDNRIDLMGNMDSICEDLLDEIKITTPSSQKKKKAQPHQDIQI